MWTKEGSKIQHPNGAGGRKKWREGGMSGDVGLFGWTAKRYVRRR